MYVGTGTPPAGADVVVGVAKAVDGDTLVVRTAVADKLRVRLAAVDAPELRQICGANMRCGEDARDAAQALLDAASGRVRCVPRPRPDRYGRVVAKCFVRNGGDVDIAASLVSDGLAVAYRQYGTDYVKLENVARKSKK